MILPLRFHIPHVGHTPIPGEGIVVLINLNEHRPLVLVADERDKNQGASVTNTIQSVIKHVEDATGISHESMQFVEMDSEGCFDEVIATDHSNHDAGFTVTWKPLWSENHNRTLEAFFEKYGNAARDLINELSARFGGQNLICPQPQPQAA